MAKYASLAELVGAIRREEEFEVVAYLDNDQVSFVSNAAGAGDSELLDLHPHEVQEQALALLGIETEAV